MIAASCQKQNATTTKKRLKRPSKSAENKEPPTASASIVVQSGGACEPRIAIADRFRILAKREIVRHPSMANATTFKEFSVPALISRSITECGARRLHGEVAVPGDKSISHRALMLGAMAFGETRIKGLLEGEDVLRTADALRHLGARITRGENGTWHVRGVGVGGFHEPDDVLDMGNSGTACRLLMGALASHDLHAVFTGDASLRGRPMGRVTTPLTKIGARFMARDGDRLPLALHGASDPLAIAYRLPVASAQVKSAVLLAGLNTPGVTRIVEPRPTRDHSELMLRHFGAEVVVRDDPEGFREITLNGQPELKGCSIEVAGDISSAAFVIVAALIVPGSHVIIRDVGLNPLRTGVVDTLLDMGGDIEITNRRTLAGEPVGDISVRSSELKGVDVPAERAPAMIDEYPILAIAAAFATGDTVMEGLAELRVKESDRLGAVAEGLKACGVACEEGEDRLCVHGVGALRGRVPGGGNIRARLDHRIAMAFLVLGMACDDPIRIDDGAPIETSFPGFCALMNGLGADIVDA